MYLSAHVFDNHWLILAAAKKSGPTGLFTGPKCEELMGRLGPILRQGMSYDAVGLLSCLPFVIIAILLLRSAYSGLSDIVPQFFF